MLMQLGDFQFRISTLAYQSLVKQYRYRWSVQNTIDKDEDVQYSGVGTQTISFSGVSYPIHNTLEPNEALKAEADKHEPLILVDAEGNVLGNFVIEEVTFKQSNFHKSGVPIHQEFDITIRKHS